MVKKRAYTGSTFGTDRQIPRKFKDARNLVVALTHKMHVVFPDLIEARLEELVAQMIEVREAHYYKYRGRSANDFLHESLDELEVFAVNNFKNWLIRNGVCIKTPKA